MNVVWKALLLTCAGTSLALAQGSVAGEKWKITSQMQMGGMSMPGMSNEICKEPGDDSVPVQTEKNCEVYDIKRVGNVQSFKMRCTGKEAMDGSAEFTYLGPDHYKGKMQVNAQGESMTMNMEGRKIGSCDGGEVNLQAKKAIAESQAQMAASEKMMVEQCRKFAAEATSPQLIMSQHCNTPENVQTFCATVRPSHDHFQMFSDSEKANVEAKANYPGALPLTDAAKLCGFSIDDQRAHLCKTAEQNGKFKFMAAQCPVEAQGLAAAQCAGRRYTAIAERYRDFCSEYASEQARQAENTPAGKAKSIFGKGKKALGGLLGN